MCTDHNKNELSGFIGAWQVEEGYLRMNVFVELEVKSWWSELLSSLVCEAPYSPYKMI